jgi:hypothetical protein
LRLFAPLLLRSGGARYDDIGFEIDWTLRPTPARFLSGNGASDY